MLATVAIKQWESNIDDVVDSSYIEIVKYTDATTLYRPSVLYGPTALCLLTCVPLHDFFFNLLETLCLFQCTTFNRSLLYSQASIVEDDIVYNTGTVIDNDSITTNIYDASVIDDSYYGEPVNFYTESSIEKNKILKNIKKNSTRLPVITRELLYVQIQIFYGIISPERDEIVSISIPKPDKTINKIKYNYKIPEDIRTQQLFMQQESIAYENGQKKDYTKWDIIPTIWGQQYRIQYTKIDKKKQSVIVDEYIDNDNYIQRWEADTNATSTNTTVYNEIKIKYTIYPLEQLQDYSQHKSCNTKIYNTNHKIIWAYLYTVCSPQLYERCIDDINNYNYLKQDDNNNTDNNDRVNLVLYIQRWQCTYEGYQRIHNTITSQYSQCFRIQFYQITPIQQEEILTWQQLEKSVFIVSSNIRLLLPVCETLQQLQLPFNWVHTYIPLLPKMLIHTIALKEPYLIGITEQAQINSIYIKSTVLFVDIDNKFVGTYDKYNNIKSNTIFNKQHRLPNRQSYKMYTICLKYQTQFLPQDKEFIIQKQNITDCTDKIQYNENICKQLLERWDLSKKDININNTILKKDISIDPINMLLNDSIILLPTDIKKNKKLEYQQRNLFTKESLVSIEYKIYYYILYIQSNDMDDSDDEISDDENENEQFPLALEDDDNYINTLQYRKYLGISKSHRSEYSDITITDNTTTTSDSTIDIKPLLIPKLYSKPIDKIKIYKNSEIIYDKLLQRRNSITSNDYTTNNNDFNTISKNNEDFDSVNILQGDFWTWDNGKIVTFSSQYIKNTIISKYIIPMIIVNDINIRKDASVQQCGVCYYYTSSIINYKNKNKIINEQYLQDKDILNKKKNYKQKISICDGSQPYNQQYQYIQKQLYTVKSVRSIRYNFISILVSQQQYYYPCIVNKEDIILNQLQKQQQSQRVYISLQGYRGGKDINYKDTIVDTKNTENISEIYKKSATWKEQQELCKNNKISQIEQCMQASPSIQIYILNLWNKAICNILQNDNNTINENILISSIYKKDDKIQYQSNNDIFNMNSFLSYQKPEYQNIQNQQINTKMFKNFIREYKQPIKWFNKQIYHRQYYKININKQLNIMNLLGILWIKTDKYVHTWRRKQIYLEDKKLHFFPLTKQIQMVLHIYNTINIYLYRQYKDNINIYIDEYDSIYDYCNTNINKQDEQFIQCKQEYITDIQKKRQQMYLLKEKDTIVQNIYKILKVIKHDTFTLQESHTQLTIPEVATGKTDYMLQISCNDTTILLCFDNKTVLDSWVSMIRARLLSLLNYNTNTINTNELSTTYKDELPSTLINSNISNKGDITQKNELLKSDEILFQFFYKQLYKNSKIINIQYIIEMHRQVTSALNNCQIYKKSAIKVNNS